MRPIDADALKVRMFRSNEFNCDTGSFDLPVVPWHDIEDAETLDYVLRQQWISVKDRLPERFENVLVCTKHEMLLCHYDGDEWVINYDGEYAGYDYEITHWMPLPEFPKEE